MNRLKQRKKLVAGLIILAGISSLIFLSLEDPAAEAVFQTGKGNHTVELEVADSPEEWEKGLMNRSSLAEAHGMLFVFPDEKERAFWMKNTYIPLDIIFISSDGRVLNVEEAEPQPHTPEKNLMIYRSRGQAKYVIEVNQGFSDRHGIERGDKVYITVN